MLPIEIKAKEGQKERWSIFIEGEEWKVVHRSIFGRRPSAPKVESLQEWQPAFDAYEYQRVKGYVLWRLSTQSYHSEQIARLLQQRLVQPKTITRVIREFKEAGYLNDQQWLQSFMQINQKRYSTRVLIAKLRQKGLSQEALEQVSNEWKDPAEEQSALQHLLQTRYRSKDLTNFKEKQKVIAALLRRGYAYEQVKIVLEIGSNLSR